MRFESIDSLNENEVLNLYKDIQTVLQTVVMRIVIVKTAGNMFRHLTIEHVQIVIITVFSSV